MTPDHAETILSLGRSTLMGAIRDGQLEPIYRRHRHGTYLIGITDESVEQLRRLMDADRITAETQHPVRDRCGNVWTPPARGGVCDRWHSGINAVEWTQIDAVEIIWPAECRCCGQGVSA